MANELTHVDSHAPANTSLVATTQELTQSTQHASQPDYTADGNLWGVLLPCSLTLPRYYLYKTRQTYRIGRNPEEVDIYLAGLKISSTHCHIEWDGDEGAQSSVKVDDMSRNGTFINDALIGKGNSAVLRDGNEIAFGSRKPDASEGGAHDYRFVYRHVAYLPPSGGVHKSYDMQHELGKGACGTVMKALHRSEGEWYAVKILQTGKLGVAKNAIVDGVPTTPEATRLLREITILEGLRHENICQYKEVFMSDSTISIVLEYVAGGDLFRYLYQREKQGRRIKEPEVKHITRQICEALAYVHGKGIAHRDLKLENVLLTKDEPPVIKVADFGLAKILDTFTELDVHISTVCGTPLYLAPEVVDHGPEGYETIVDSYSVGIITFLMLTMAENPYVHDDDSADLKTRVLNRQVNWDLLGRLDVSEQAKDFVRHLLKVDPHQRLSLTNARHHPWLRSQPRDLLSQELAPRVPDAPAATRPVVEPDSSHAVAGDPIARQSRSKAGSRTPSRARTLEPSGLPQPTEDTNADDEEAHKSNSAAADERDATASRPKTRRTTKQRSNATRAAGGVPAGTTATATPDVDGKKTRGGSKTARMPANRRTRSRTAETAGSDASEDVPGLRLLRRSPRLNP
ncbi:kinase-like domain-containing protein [Trametes elegans]|nr:kinase-like domain-containing protein [Trametes elegans]